MAYPGGFKAPHGPVQGSGRVTASTKRRVNRVMAAKARARAFAAAAPPQAYPAYPGGTPTPGVGVGGPAALQDDYDPGGIVAWGTYRNPQPVSGISRSVPQAAPITRTPVPQGRMVGAPVPPVPFPGPLPLHTQAPSPFGPALDRHQAVTAQQQAFLDAIRRAIARMQGRTVGL